MHMTMAIKFDPAVEFISHIAQPTARNAPTTAVLNIKGLGTVKLTQIVIKIISSMYILKTPLYYLMIPSCIFLYKIFNF